MAQLVDQAVLDDRQYLASLKRIDSNVAKLTKDAQKGFDDVAKSAKGSGSQIGVTAGIVSSLTTEFINLGKAGIDALIRITEQAIQTAIQFDTLKARLGGIFDGSQEAADQAFTFIQEKSRALGIDLSELAGAFLPKTESLQQFERVAKIATALARSDPEQGAIGARIALIEALSGTFTSLQRRFEIPKKDINRIKEAFDTKGMEGFLTELENVLKESGKSFDDLANTAQTSFSKLAISGQQILGRLGQPIVESLQKAADKINNFISENEDDIIVFADTIGRAIADAIDFISSIDLSQLDTTQLIAFADTIYQIVEAAQLVIPQIIAFVANAGSLAANLPVVSQTLDGLSYILNGLDDAFITLTQVIALVNAELAAFSAASNKAAIGGDLLQAGLASASLNYSEVVTQLQEAQSKLNSNTDAQAAYNDSLQQSLQQFENYKNSLQENRTAQDNLRQSLDETANAGTGAADSILAAAQAERQAAEDADKLTEAQTKVNEKMAEAEKDFQQKLQDIDIETERKRLDIAIEFAQKREDAARKNVQELDDIQTKYAQDVDDAATDLARKEEDIARKHGEDRIDLERENRQKRVDIERSYRQNIQDIQRQFLIDADEAEQKRDAVAFLRALKERNQKVQEAQINRQREIQEQQVTNTRKTEELRIQQEREIEEARLANERKLEDLRTNLDRQIEAQNLAYSRQLEEIAIGEQRKNEELTMARERDIEDARRAYDRKLEDLKASLEAELAVIAEYAARKAELMAQANQSTTYNPKYSNPNIKVPAGTSHGPSGQKAVPVTKSIYGYAAGGSVAGGMPVLVGERGPELFVPPSSGAIVPNSAFVGNAFTPQQAVQNISNSKSQQISIPDAAGLLGNPVAVRQIHNIVLQILGEAT